MILDRSWVVLGGLESLLACLGSILGRLGALLGRSWGILGRSFGTSWDGLGPSWGGFGAAGELKTMIFVRFFNTFWKTNVLSKHVHLGRSWAFLRPA